MNKLIALGLVLLFILPLALGYVYVKPGNNVSNMNFITPNDIKFRAGGVQRFNEYFYDARVQNRELKVSVALTPVNPPIFATGQPAFYPRGMAMLTSLRSAYYPRGHMTLSVKDLRESGTDNTYYQAWLVNSKSGYPFNLGRFDTVGGGVGTLEYWGTNYWDAYDTMIITREPRDDTDPRPSKDVVLMGMIKQNTYQEPMPPLGERASYGWSYFNW